MVADAVKPSMKAVTPSGRVAVIFADLLRVAFDLSACNDAMRFHGFVDTTGS
jgi:hypothetical protein